MKGSKKISAKSFFIMGAVIAVPIMYLALIIAPLMEEYNLIQVILYLSGGGEVNFAPPVSGDSLRFAGIMLLIYIAVVVGMYFMGGKYRKGEEYGSAIWGDAAKISRKYEDKKNFSANKIMSQNFRISYNSRKHRRNLNTLVVGGSGAGKTLFYAKPNLLQCNTSFVVLDPKGEILRAVGNLLKNKGYKIRVLNLLEFEKSDNYNPFPYLKNEDDVTRMVTNIFKSTKGEGGQSADPFWDQAAEMLLKALVFYLHLEALPEYQNFATVMELLRFAEVSDDPKVTSALEDLMSDLEKDKPDHTAIKFWKNYNQGAGDTKRSIQITLAARLEKFNLEHIKKLTMTDELELGKMGEEKTALFAVISDSDKSYNFIVSTLYTQLFQSLFFSADFKHGGELPIPVHFMMDEFANVALPDDFPEVLSTMRSRGVSVSIILQNISQLKALFEKKWESIIGNCDEFLYLGGNEKESHKYVSELLGKETIDNKTHNRSRGRQGSFTENFQSLGRELLSPEEVRMLDNAKCLLFVRGEYPIVDDKYNYFSHPNIELTPDHKPKDGSKAVEPYKHNEIQELGEGEFKISFNVSEKEKENAIDITDLVLEAMNKQGFNFDN
jgi:type IV secretion system protein VirD4